MANRWRIGRKTPPMTAEAIVKHLATWDPIVPLAAHKAYANCMLAGCGLCMMPHENQAQAHTENCPWLLARKWLDAKGA